MRTALSILILAAILVLPGCKTPQKGTADEDKELMTVDFEQGKTIQYRFRAKREITIDWDPEGKSSRPGKQASEKNTESLEIVMAYTPIEVDPFGLTTIKAECKSVKASRTKRTAGGRDAVENFAGKTYTFTIGPTAKIEDNSQLYELVKEVGQKAFRSNTSRGKIKEPDMINDYVATQWFLWDSVSSMSLDAEGLEPGQSWKSQLSIPSPMVMRKARDVVYTLNEIRDTPRGRIAIIGSSYTFAETVPKTWPIPYTGTFQMSGTFGFLAGYKVLGLEGEGTEEFNLDTGQSEQYSQKYELKMQASIPLGISAKPQITIIQEITAKRL